MTPSRPGPIVCYNSSISQIRHQPPKRSILLLLSVLQSLLVLPVRLNPPSGSLRIPLTVFIVNLLAFIVSEHEQTLNQAYLDVGGRFGPNPIPNLFGPHARPHQLMK